jgi:hypothetical protein
MNWLTGTKLWSLHTVQRCTALYTTKWFTDVGRLQWDDSHCSTRSMVQWRAIARAHNGSTSTLGKIMISFAIMKLASHHKKSQDAADISCNRLLRGLDNESRTIHEVQKPEQYLETIGGDLYAERSQIRSEYR